MPLEIAWTIVPTLVIIGFVGVPMIPVLFDLGRDPSEDAFPVRVQGEQFQWTFEYPSILDSQGQPVTTILGELHVPAGREIALTITSIDVIHSFGVPRLAGTRDAIPGQEEQMWIKVDEPGSYAGQCRELCGVGHADMLITVIAHSEEDFDDWAEEMVAGVKSVPDDNEPGALSASGSGE